MDIKFKQRPLPTTLIRKLTKKDCAKRFHLFNQTAEKDTFLYEKCNICGKVIKYPVLLECTDEVKRKWANDHKLDLLQPTGPTAKDFIYYYGEVKFKGKQGEANY